MLAYMLKIAEANPSITPNEDTFHARLMHESSKNRLEGRLLAYSQFVA